MKDLKCQNNKKKVFNRKYISGLPTKFWIPPRKNNNITNIFTISRIVNDISSNNLFIIGKLYDNLETNLYNLTIDLVYPKKTINCSLHSTSKYVKAYIYCQANNNSDILIENQIIFTDNTSYKLLLINQETFIVRDKVIDINRKFYEQNQYKSSALYCTFFSFIIIKIYLALLYNQK